jgi:lipopolysaccharide transport system permease protein
MVSIISEIKAIISRRELLAQMIGREIKARYKQSVLGYFWVILNPFFQMLVMSFAFSIILRIPTKSADNIPYSVFLFVGLLPWNLFATSISSSCKSLIDSSTLITKIYFPRSIIVLASIFSKLIDLFFASTILILYMIYYQVPININIFWIIPIFFIQQIFTIGISLFFAASNLIYRDIQHLVTLVITLWFYLTPVIYPMELVPEKYKIFFQVNPIAVIINAYRQTVLGGLPPNYQSIIVALVVSILTLMLGLAYFKNKEKIFADNI